MDYGKSIPGYCPDGIKHPATLSTQEMHKKYNWFFLSNVHWFWNLSGLRSQLLKYQLKFLKKGWGRA